MLDAEDLQESSPVFQTLFTSSLNLEVKKMERQQLINCSTQLSIIQRVKQIKILMQIQLIPFLCFNPLCMFVPDNHNMVSCRTSMWIGINKNNGMKRCYRILKLEKTILREDHIKIWFILVHTQHALCMTWSQVLSDVSWCWCWCRPLATQLPPAVSGLISLI